MNSRQGKRTKSPANTWLKFKILHDRETFISLELLRFPHLQHPFLRLDLVLDLYSLWQLRKTKIHENVFYVPIKLKGAVQCLLLKQIKFIWQLKNSEGFTCKEKRKLRSTVGWRSVVWSCCFSSSLHLLLRIRL